MTNRASSGQLEHSEETYWHTDPEDAFGGMALYATPADFFAVVRSLLLDDGRLLSSASLQEFFKPQLSDAARENMAEFLSNKSYSDLGMGAFFPYGSGRDHALAGMLLLEDLPEEECPRRPGTVAWIGQPNFYWVSLKCCSPLHPFPFWHVESLMLGCWTSSSSTQPPASARFMPVS